MNNILLILCCIFIIYFLKDIIAIIIGLCLLAVCFYYLSGYNDNILVNNVFVTSTEQEINK